MSRHNFASILLILIILTFSVITGTSASENHPASFFQQDQSSSLQMQATPLLQGNIKYGEWLPVWIEIENTGPDIQAEVRILVPSNSGTMAFTTLAELPSSSRKRFEVYALPNNYSRQLRVELVTNGDVVLTQNITVRPQPTITYIIGLITSERGALSLLSSVRTPGVERSKVLVDMTVEDIPSRYQGLRSLDLIILNDIDSSIMTSAQIEALKTWVQQGGRLVIGNGANALKTTAGLSDELAPFQLQGVQDVRTLTGLEAFVGQDKPIRVPGPFAITKANTGEGIVLSSQDDIPLLVEYSFGRGFIDYVALDLTSSPFDAWNGTISFWEKLIGPGAAYPQWLPADMSVRQQNASNMPYALSNLPILDLPSTGSLASLLGIYIVFIGPINYLILRNKKKLHLAWITIPAITLIFALASFALGYILHGTDVFINKIAVIQPDENGKAFVHSYIGLFSPAQTSYEIEVKGGGLVSPLSLFQDPWQSFGGSGIGAGRGMTLVQGDPAYIRGVSLDQWSMQNFMVEGLTSEFGIIGAELKLQDDSLVGRVKNNTAYNLSESIIVIGDRFERLGDIGAGEEKTVNLKLDGMDRPPEFYGPSISYRIFEQEMTGPGAVSRKADVKRMVVEGLLERPAEFSAPKMRTGLSGQSIPRTPILIAWIDQAPPEVSVGGETPAQQTTAVVYLQLPYDFPTQGQISIPSSLISGAMTENPFSGGSCGPGYLTSVYLASGQATFAYSIPQFASNLEIENLKLAIYNDSGWTTAPNVSIYDWELEQWSGLQGIKEGVNLITEASRYVNTTGTINIRLEGNNLNGCFYVQMGAEGYLKK